MTGTVIQNEYSIFKDQIFLTLITTKHLLKMTQKSEKFLAKTLLLVKHLTSDDKLI